MKDKCLLAGQEDGDGEDADEDQVEDDGDVEGEQGVGKRRYPQRDRAKVQVQHYVPGTGGGLRRAGWGSSKCLAALGSALHGPDASSQQTCSHACCTPA